MASLITGADGYLGSALARALSRRGEALVLHTRSTEPEVEGRSLRLDLADTSFSPAMLTGVDTVYHCAGIAHQAASAAEYQQVVLKATEDLATASQQAGVRRFVFLSSTKAISGGTDYAVFKRRAEEALRDNHGEAMSVFVVRPALVYGDFPKGHIATLINLVKRHLPAPPDIGSRSMISRADLIDLLVELGQCERQGYYVLNVTDGETYSTRRLHQAIRGALGKQPGFTLPLLIWRIACAVADRLSPTNESRYGKLFADQTVDLNVPNLDLSWQATRRFEDELAPMLASN